MGVVLEELYVPEKTRSGYRNVAWRAGCIYPLYRCLSQSVNEAKSSTISSSRTIIKPVDFLSSWHPPLQSGPVGHSHTSPRHGFSPFPICICKSSFHHQQLQDINEPGYMSNAGSTRHQPDLPVPGLNTRYRSSERRTIYPARWDTLASWTWGDDGAA